MSGASAIHRTVRFTFEIGVPPSEHPTLVWVPRPVEDPWQRELGASFPQGAPLEEGTDPKTGNRTVRLSIPPSREVTAIEVSFEIERKPRHHPRPPAEQYRSPPSTDPRLAPWLIANAKVPITDAIADQAHLLGTPGEAPITLARRAFDHLLKEFSYDAGGCTPERMDQLGDLVVACDLRTGTCTEFHGLFIGYMRVLGVPSRFTFGFNLPRDTTEGRIKGYHCWSNIALPDGSWFPVDVSEAWKRPELADFYFGSLDADRIAFTADRDVTLAPAQQAGPIDKFIFPYCEAGGRAVVPALGFRFVGLGQ